MRTAQRHLARSATVLNMLAGCGMQALSSWGHLGPHGVHPAGQPACRYTYHSPTEGELISANACPQSWGQGIAGSNPAVSTRTCRSGGFGEEPEPPFFWILGKPPTARVSGGQVSGGLALRLENRVQGRRALGERGPDLEPVDGLGHAGGDVADELAVPSSGTSLPDRMDTNECRSSRGTSPPPAPPPW